MSAKDAPARPTYVTRQEATIVSLLRDHGPLYGLQVVERAAGSIPKSSVYVVLHRMVGKALLAQSKDGLGRTVYQTTPHALLLLDNHERASR
jgi:hypothetical protein